MQYFYRAHKNPEAVLDFAKTFFTRHGFQWRGSGDRVSYANPSGTVNVEVEIEGGHYTRVTAATSDVGEAEIDKVAKRFLAELHAQEEPTHSVRGAY
jgi:hypothetical protein